MEADKEFIDRKVAQFRAKSGLAEVDNVAEPAGEEPPTPTNSPAPSDRDDSASSDEQANEIRRILANVVELKCSAKAKK